MKTITGHLKALSLVLLPVLCAPVSYGQVSQQDTASTAAIAVDRTQYFNQTSASAPAAQPMPFTLNFNIRGTAQNITNWGPAFYKPGSGGVPQTGSSTATNTGTLNFSATPNNGGYYMFAHDFATDADLASFYPYGAYGVNFQGSSAPTPNTFTAGLAFDSNVSYPATTPQVTIDATNGNNATWSSGALKIKPSGVTQLNLSNFSEYGVQSLAPHGAVITAGIYKAATGNVISNASIEAYYLPTLGVNQSKVTNLTIDGSWLTPGVTYTLEIQYVIIASDPEEGYLNGENFQGVASYVKNTSLNVTVETPAIGSGVKADFNGDAKSDIIWRQSSTGRVFVSLMNGTTPISNVDLLTDTDWAPVGTGDFNSDGKADILWRQSSTGRVIVWLMDGTTRISYTDILTDPDWTVVGTGDFNNDGKSDILWRQSSTGRVIVWLMNGTSRITYTDILTDTDWTVVGTGDFNSDGQSDILWRQSSTGRVIVWLMNGTSRISYTDILTDPNWTIGGTGDFNGDGKSDILWRQSSTGRVIAWLMNGTTRISYTDIATDPDLQVVNR